MSYGYQGYDTPPQIGFVGSSIPGLPTTLDEVNPAYYDQILKFVMDKGGRLASFSGVVLYDTLRIDAGVLPTRDFVFFQNPVGATQGLFVAGTQYTKQDIDIHQWISNGGQLSQGYEALLWEIGVQFHVVASLDNSVQAAPLNSINLALDPGTAATVAATDATLSANVMRAFQESLFFSFFINQTNFELGPGWRFPAGNYGISGYNALAHSTAQIALGVFTDGAANNGFGWSYQMPVMRHLPPLTKFGVRMSVQNPFTTLLTGPVRVVVTLGGLGVQPVTG